MQENKIKKIFSPISLLVLGIAFVGIWITFFIPTDDRLQVTYFDVGQGDSAYVSFPDGKNALIDGGPDKKVLEGLGRNMPFYRRKIDIIYLSHPHADHLAGLIHVLNRYEVGRVVLTRAVHSAPEYQEFLTLIKEKNIPTTESILGTDFDFSGEARIKVLYPQGTEGVANLNDTSAVLSLEFKKTRFLFMGDLEKDSTGKMISINPDLKADVIKVPHHGSRDAFNEELYKKASPKYAVISVGENKYGHPCPEIIDFFNKSGIGYLRTDRDGDVKFASDGESVAPKQIK